jgi:biopolymer transport protein TolR
MGMSGSGGGSKRPVSEINITPMVDVMLVLLVIFMVTAPVIKQIDALQVNLPLLEGQPSETIVTEDARTLAINPDGTVAKAGSKTVEESYGSMAELITELKAYREESEKGKKTAVVVIAGDREAKWERVMQVWNAAKTAGITQISFQVDDGGKAAGEKK